MLVPLGGRGCYWTTGSEYIEAVRALGVYTLLLATGRDLMGFYSWYTHI